jgi:hypothetical protein
MSTNHNTTVYGTDNHMPVYDPYASWKIWGMHEIYIGQGGLNKFVPKVNDLVMEPTTLTTYIVNALNNLFIPQLMEVVPPYAAGVVSQTDLMFGTSVSATNNMYLAYLDKSVMPYRLSVDAVFHVYHQDAHRCKLFYGVDTSATGEVIGRLYNSAGVVTSDAIGLTPIALDSHTNYHVKAINQCSTVKDMVDGDIITAVIYDSAGVVLQRRQLRIETTTYIKDLNAIQKTVSHISLQTPFLSATENTVVNIPINILVDSVNFVGVVHYTDGSTERYAVDGVHFELFGLASFSATIPGHRTPIVLRYRLKPNEASLHSTSAANPDVTASYYFVSTNQNDSYVVKLHAYPFWNAVTSRYSLRWIMTSVDRDVYYVVTPHIQLSPGSAFDGTLYNETQYLDVSVNLHSVNPSLQAFVHVQRVAVVLFSPPSPSITEWRVKNNANSSDPYFGDNLSANYIMTNRVNLSNNITNFSTWLQAMYHNSSPLTDQSIEITYPTPTHFVLRYGANFSSFVEKPIAQWDQDITIAHALPNGSSVRVEFNKNVGTQVMYLNVIELMVK